MDETDLHRIIYVSSATSRRMDSDVSEIIAASQAKNAAVGVTGVLLFVEGSYFQVLEGPADAVHGIFASIWQDPRHRRVTILHQGPARERYFADWAMGCLVVAASDLPDGARRIRDGQSVFEWMIARGDAVMIQFIKTFFEINMPRSRSPGAMPMSRGA